MLVDMEQRVAIVVEQLVSERERLASLLESNFQVYATSSLAGADFPERNVALLVADKQILDDAGAELVLRLRSASPNLRIFYTFFGAIDETTNSWLKNVLEAVSIRSEPNGESDVDRIWQSLSMTKTPTPVTTAVTDPDPDAVPDKFEELRRTLRDELHDEWLALLEELAELENGDGERLKPVLSELHRIKGTAGFLGLNLVGCCAEKAEFLLKSFYPVEGASRQLLFEVIRSTLACADFSIIEFPS